MKLTIAALTAAAALAACGGNTAITAEEARTAMPSAQQAKIDVPQSAAALTGAPLGSEAVTFQTAPYADATIKLASAVNLGVLFTLRAVELVVGLPPTACAGATCTWGPWTNVFEVNTWQLTVTKVDDGHYAWGLAARPKSNQAAGFITFVSGDAFPAGVRHVGNGDFIVDLDAAAKLDRRTGEVAQVGRIEVTYDNRTSASVSAKFLGTTDDDINSPPNSKVNAAYQFQATATGGDLQVASRNLTSHSVLTLHSRWTATGAGRGDASFFDGASATYTRSQCWDGNTTLFNLVFQVTDPVTPGNGDTGLESSCAFSPAAPPVIVAP
jgi:hypothetical protein